MGKYKYRTNIKYIDFFDFYLLEWIPRYEDGHEHARASLAVGDLGFGNRRVTTVLRPLGGGTHVKFLTIFPRFSSQIFLLPKSKHILRYFFPAVEGIRAPGTPPP